MGRGGPGRQGSAVPTACVSTLLRWRAATTSDVPERQRFVCAEPARPVGRGRHKTHPAWYELDVQSWLRSHRGHRGETLLIGTDDHGIAAMIAWTEVRDPSEVLLQAVAVAARHRHRGGEHAHEAVVVALEHIEANAVRSGAGALLVEARIHPDNHPSKRLCTDAGFQCASAIDPHLERWILYRPL